MALAFVQQKAGTVSDGGLLAFDSNVGAETLLVAAIVVPGVGVTVSGITDTLGNTWARAIHKVGTAAGAGTGITAELWWTWNAAGGACALTCDWSASANGQVVIAEFSGFTVGVTVDDTATGETDNTNPQTHGSITTTEDEAVLISCLGFASAFTVSSRLADWQALTAGSRRDSQYKITATTETTDGEVTCGTNEDSTGCIASFYATVPGGGGGASTGGLLLLGVG